MELSALFCRNQVPNDQEPGGAAQPAYPGSAPDCGVSLISMQDPSGAARSLSRAQFMGLAWPTLGRGSSQHYGFLFDSVVACQEGGGGGGGAEPLEQDVSITWRSLCSFLLLQLSHQIKQSRKGSLGCWGPPRELSCPHREPVQKVWSSAGEHLSRQ